jgi:hypothetical protein
MGGEKNGMFPSPPPAAPPPASPPHEAGCEKKQRGPLVKFGPFEQAIGVLLVMGLGAKVPAKRQLTRSRESRFILLARRRRRQRHDE